MDGLVSMIGFALLVLETLIGLVANGFIVLINCIDRFRSRKLSLTDLILICLGSSRLMWQAGVMLHVTMLSLFLHTYILKQGYLIFRIMWIFMDSVNLWFAACLGVWYLTRIAIFSHPAFLQVKQRFSGMLPWLLLGSVVFSVLKTISAFSRSLSGMAICDPYKFILNNTGYSEIKMSRACVDLATSVIVPNLIPFVIFLSSTILLMISLWKHTRRLQHNGTSVRDLNTNVHLSAIKALASFAILYLSGFVASNLQSILSWRTNDPSWRSVVFHNVGSLYPSGHAVILILINPKLKQAWVRMMHHLQCLRFVPFP